jgi:hypothetical protein
VNEIVSSLFKTVLVSLAFGLIGFFGYDGIDSFVSWFGISLVSQFLFFFIFNSLVQRYENYKYSELINAREIEIEKNIIPMFCANCNHPNEVHIDIKGGENKFVCDNCDTENAVLVSISNAQKTNPVYKKDVLTEEDIKDLK